MCREEKEKRVSEKAMRFMDPLMTVKTTLSLSKWFTESSVYTCTRIELLWSIRVNRHNEWAFVTWQVAKRLGATFIPIRIVSVWMCVSLCRYACSAEWPSVHSPRKREVIYLVSYVGQWKVMWRISENPLYVTTHWFMWDLVLQVTLTSPLTIKQNRPKGSSEKFFPPTWYRCLTYHMKAVSP